MKPANTPRSQHGFTLIELLVVIAIIALLVSILVPSLTAAREMARKAVCQTHLKSMGLGVVMYTQEFNEVLPPSYAGYKGNPNNWRCAWSDIIVKYYDATARPIPREIRETWSMLRADVWEVGNQKPSRGSNWAVNAQTWGGIVYAPSLNCPSQKYDFDYNRSPVYHYSMSYTFTYDEVDLTRNEIPADKRCATLGRLKDPTSFCQFVDSGAGQNVYTVLSWWTNASLLNWANGGPVHVGKTWNIGMTAGNVKTLVVGDQAKAYPYTNQIRPPYYPYYPFNHPDP